MIVHALALAAAVTATPPPSLGAAAGFSILGGSGVTNTGLTRVTGNVGTASGAVTGFPPATIVPGVGDVVDAGTASKDLARAWDEITALPCAQNASITLPVTPEASVVYCVSTVADLTQFNAHGHDDAVWIIRITGPLTTPPGSSMQLLEGAQSSHIFWQVTGTATLSERSAFVGSLLTNGGITLGEGVTVSGRLLARQGTVTLATDDINLCCDPIAQSALPNGAEKVFYSNTIIPDGGTWPYTFSLFAGTDTPLGLKLDDGGTLSGVPQESGTYTFIVMVKDYKGCTSIHTYTIVICGTSVPENVTLPDAEVGKPYGETITVSDPQEFTTTRLPVGLELTPTTCTTQARISGTPTKEEGLFTFTLTGKGCDGGCSIIRNYTILVKCPLIKVLPEITDYDVTIGTDFTKDISANGGVKPYTFVPSALLSITPEEQGVFKFTFTATDANGCSGMREYSIHAVCPPITIKNDSPLQSAVYNPINIPLIAGDLPGNYTFTTAKPLPEWLDLSKMGSLTAPLPTAGDLSFTVIATHDLSGCTGSKDFILHVEPCPAITLAPTTLPHGTLLVVYNKQISVTGGTPPYVVKVTGTFPPGITVPVGTPPTPPLILSGQPPMTLFGPPTVVGSYTFTVTATDSQGCSASQTYTIVIRPLLLPGLVIPTLSTWAMLMLAVLLSIAGLILIRRG